MDKETVTFEGMISDAYTLRSEQIRIIVLVSDYYADVTPELIRWQGKNIGIVMYRHNGDDVEHMIVSGVVSKIKTARFGGLEFVFNLNDAIDYYPTLSNYKLLDTIISFSVYREKKVKNDLDKGRIRKSSRTTSKGEDFSGSAREAHGGDS